MLIGLSLGWWLWTAVLVMCLPLVWLVPKGYRRYALCGYIAFAIFASLVAYEAGLSCAFAGTTRCPG